MWIFSTDGFLSAVRDNLNPGHVLLRFRHPDHAERILALAYPGNSNRSRRPEIQVTPPPRDYRWKVSIPAGRFNILLCNLSEQVMQYDNFKDACHRKHPDDATPLTRVWGVMNGMQQDYVDGFLNRPARRAPSPGPELALDREPAYASQVPDYDVATRQAPKKPRKRAKLKMHGTDDAGVYHPPMAHEDPELTPEEIARLSRP